MAGPISWTADEDDGANEWQHEGEPDTPTFEELVSSTSQLPSGLTRPESSKPTRSIQAPSVRQRTNKHAPTAMSSRRPVSRFRQPELNGKRKYRDPRFDNVSQGEPSAHQFQHNYSFLTVMRKREVHELRTAATQARKRIKSTPSTVRLDAEAELDKLEQSRKRLESQIARDREFELKNRAEKEHSTSSRTLDKGCSYKKRADSQAKLLEAKYEDLRNHKGRRGIEKLILSRRRKLAGRPK